MRILALAEPFAAQSLLRPDFQVVEGIRPRLGTGEVCTCGDPACQTPGEHSRFLVWVERPATGLASLAERAAAHPRANLGVATGQPGASGLIVLEFETPEAEAAFGARLGDLPPTVATVSPEGGVARWFLCRQGLYAARDVLGAGVVVRAAGEWAMVPGSVTPAGVYRWADGAGIADIPFAALPVRWFKALRKVQPGARVFGLRPAVEVGAIH